MNLVPFLSRETLRKVAEKFKGKVFAKGRMRRELKVVGAEKKVVFVVKGNVFQLTCPQLNTKIAFTRNEGH